jgi:Uma2 family endonuclease
MGQKPPKYLCNAILQAWLASLFGFTRAGVPEYWVVSIPSRELIVHRGLDNGRYQEVTALSGNDPLSAASAPEKSISVKLVFGDEQ